MEYAYTTTTSTYMYMLYTYKYNTYVCSKAHIVLSYTHVLYVDTQGTYIHISSLAK